MGAAAARSRTALSVCPVVGRRSTTSVSSHREPTFDPDPPAVGPSWGLHPRCIASTSARVESVRCVTSGTQACRDMLARRSLSL